MGEHLVAFRDSNGRVGLIDRYCAHRQAPIVLRPQRGVRPALRLSRLEIRCGRPLRRHADRAARSSNYKDQIQTHVLSLSGTCAESSGPIWARRMLPVEFPQFEFNTLPKDRFYIRKSLLECNYLQAMEGNLDFFHTGYLHSFSTGSALDPRGQGHGAARRSHASISADAAAFRDPGDRLRVDDRRQAQGRRAAPPIGASPNGCCRCIR